MCNKIIGELYCPLCGSDQATIHEQNKGKKKFYIRCYEGHGSNVPLCGTLQATGPTGQEYIKKHGCFNDHEKAVVAPIVHEPVEKVVRVMDEHIKKETKGGVIIGPIAPIAIEELRKSGDEPVVKLQTKKSFMEMLIG